MRIQDFNRFKSPTVIQPTRAKLLLSPFTLAASTWAGASTILAQYSISNDYWFSFKTPIRAFGENFVLAIRYYDAENDVIVRYKLWEDVDEILFYPVYAGERIGLNAVLEVWSVDTTDAPVLSDDYTFYTSVLSFPPQQLCAGCCQEANSETLLIASDPSVLPPYAYCNPFCEGLCIP